MHLGALYEHLLDHLSEQEARWMIERHTALGWSDIIANPEMTITPEQRGNIESDLRHKQSGKPLSRIWGQREFWGLDFEISKQTLDPRPDTEVLVERALAHFGDMPPRSVMDLGTGSGCILIALLTEWTQTQGIGIDLSHDALKTARGNAQTHGVNERIQWICGSWADSYGATVDCLTSNPPYIREDEIANLMPEVRNHDPILALDGGKTGLDAYETIFSTLKNKINKGGRAFFEIGFDQADDMMRLSKKYRIRIENIFDDYAGNPRVVDMSCGDK